MASFVLRAVRILSSALALSAVPACGGTDAPPEAAEARTGEESSAIFHQAELTAGVTHACSLSGGSVKCWGSNGHGQLGNGTFVNAVHPVPVTLPTGFVNSIASNPWAEHTCALQNGKVYCWGNNAEGQLGDGTQTTRNAPVLVAGITGATRIAGSSRPSSIAASTGSFT